MQKYGDQRNWMEFESKFVVNFENRRSRQSASFVQKSDIKKWKIDEFVSIFAMIREELGIRSRRKVKMLYRLMDALFPGLLEPFWRKDRLPEHQFSRMKCDVFQIYQYHFQYFYLYYIYLIFDFPLGAPIQGWNYPQFRRATWYVLLRLLSTTTTTPKLSFTYTINTTPPYTYQDLIFSNKEIRRKTRYQC